MLFGGLPNMVELSLTNPNVLQYLDIHSKPFDQFKKRILQTASKNGVDHENLHTLSNSINHQTPKMDTCVHTSNNDHTSNSNVQTTKSNFDNNFQRSTPNCNNISQQKTETTDHDDETITDNNNVNNASHTLILYQPLQTIKYIELLQQQNLMIVNW